MLNGKPQSGGLWIFNIGDQGTSITFVSMAQFGAVFFDEQKSSVMKILFMANPNSKLQDGVVNSNAPRKLGHTVSHYHMAQLISCV